MGRVTTINTNLSYSSELDGSRISFGRVRYSFGIKLKRGLRYILNRPNNIILGSYSEQKNLMIYYAQNELDVKDIAKVISHEFLHMVLSNHCLETITLDNFLKKTNRYDLEKLGNGGI